MKPKKARVFDPGHAGFGAAENRPLSRRAFLQLGLLSGAGLALAACGLEPTPTPVITPTPNKTATPRAGLEILVADVLDYELTSDAWPGDFGSVTFRIHEALYEGGSVYYFCTDTSDETYAHKHKLLGECKVVGFGGMEDVRFRDPVRPGDRLIVACKMLKVRPGAIIICRFEEFVGSTMVADGKIKGIPLPVDALTGEPKAAT